MAFRWWVLYRFVHIFIMMMVIVIGFTPPVLVNQIPCLLGRFLIQTSALNDMKSKEANEHIHVCRLIWVTVSFLSSRVSIRYHLSWCFYRLLYSNNVCFHIWDPGISVIVILLEGKKHLWNQIRRKHKDKISQNDFDTETLVSKCRYLITIGGSIGFFMHYVSWRFSQEMLPTPIFSWKIHVVALHMNYGGDKSSDHGGYCPLEIIPNGLYLLGLGFARILTALFWKQPPWKPPWRKWMGGDADALLIRETLSEPSSILILRRRQVMGLYLSVLKQLPIFGKVGTLFYPALVFVDDVTHFNGVSAKVRPRSKNTSLRLTIKSVSLKEAFDKRKEVRSQSGINMKSTLLLRIRIRTNWYRVNIPKHVTDAMAFSCTIWKAKEAMPNWHTNRIKGRQKEKKEDNNIQWLLACQTYLERKQRSISFFLLFCLQCMAHISAYVIICISMFCIRLCNTLCPSIF